MRAGRPAGLWFAAYWSALLSEDLARQHNRWTGTPFVGLRFSNIMELEECERFPSFWDDARIRKWNLWGYVDARDVAESCALALEHDVEGAEHFTRCSATRRGTRGATIWPQARVVMKDRRESEHYARTS